MMNFNQGLLLVAVYSIFNNTFAHGRVLAKHGGFSELDIYPFIDKHLAYLEHSIRDKLADRLDVLFEKYGIDEEDVYNSLIQLSSFIEEDSGLDDNNKQLVPRGNRDVVPYEGRRRWYHRLRDSIKNTGGRALRFGRNYFSHLLTPVLKVAGRELFGRLAVDLERINEHSIMQVSEEFRPAFARFIYTFYELLFDKLDVKPPKAFREKYFNKKYHMDRAYKTSPLADLIKNEEFEKAVEEEEEDSDDDEYQSGGDFDLADAI